MACSAEERPPVSVERVESARVTNALRYGRSDMANVRLALLVGAALLCHGERTAGQTEATDATTPDESWWRTTPFASLPGMTTQQVLRSILPPDAVAYSPVASPDESGSVRDYVSAFRTHSRGMEPLHKYTTVFVDLIAPRHLVPPGNYFSSQFFL